MVDVVESDHNNYGLGYLADFKNYPGLDEVKTFKEYNTFSMGFGLQKDSEFLGLFNHIISKMHQTGVTRKIFQQWWNFEYLDHSPTWMEEEERTLIKFNQVFIPFIILSFGSILALAISIIESMKQKHICILYSK